MEDDIEDLTEDVLGIEELLRVDLQTLQQIFPECDEEHILAQLVQYNNHPDRVAIVTNLLIEKSYPKKKDNKGKDKVNFDPSADLGDIRKDFYNILSDVSPNYSEHWYLLMVIVAWFEFVWWEMGGQGREVMPLCASAVRAPNCL